MADLRHCAPPHIRDDARASDDACADAATEREPGRYAIRYEMSDDERAMSDIVTP